MVSRINVFMIIVFYANILLGAVGITENIPVTRFILSNSKYVEPEGISPKIITYKTPANFVNTLDSLNVEITLQAGEYAAVFVDADAGTLGYSPRTTPVPTELEPWVDSAPDWIKRQLRQNLSMLDPVYATSYADLLSGCDPLWRDELYYCLAHLAHEILELPEMYYLLPENIEYIYACDSVLNYVEIIDEGTVGGSDHISTARYVTIDTGMTMPATVTIDPEIYYRYVVFPKITDEIPEYIDRYSGYPNDPWSGYFWRTWFWGVSETMFVSGESLFCWKLGNALRARIFYGMASTTAIRTTARSE